MQKKRWRGIRFLEVASLGLLLSVLCGGFLTTALPGIAQMPVVQPVIQPAVQPISSEGGAVSAQESRGRSLYREGRFLEAIAQWEKIAKAHAVSQNHTDQASALSNLSLSYQQVGQWDDAQSAIAQSLALITQRFPERSPISQSVMAQALMAQGSLQIELGQSESALESWEQAAEAYGQAGDRLGQNRAQINQAQALRSLGFYRKSLDKLEATSQAMASEPSSELKAIALRRLGETLRLNGQLAAAQTALTQSLTIARQYNNYSEASATLLSLGHTAQSLNDNAAAQDFYTQAIEVLAKTSEAQPESKNNAAAQRLPIQLAQLSLFANTQQWTVAGHLWPTIQAQFSNLPIKRETIYYQINWASCLAQMRQNANALPSAPSLDVIVNQIRQAAQQAQSLGDRRAESHALGMLGKLYEQNQQWLQAQQLTQRALTLSETTRATDISYQWQWQLARLRNNAQNPDRSVAKSLDAYYQAVNSLSQLRGDLSTADISTQFSFEKNVEPVYRQLVSLLLQTDPKASDYQKNLASAQDVIESLRLAELDNYFQEACLDVTPIDINQVDSSAAILYTLVLEDRLSVILYLPDQPLQHFSTAVSADKVNDVAAQLRQQLVIRSRRQFFPLGETVYQWLIAPVREAIDQSGVDTLVFVLDGALQDIPMAALYDGDRFLIEDYAVALTPGLKLLNPQPWNTSKLKALIAGITESQQGRVPLPYVNSEVQKITDSIRRHTVLLDQQFTQEALSSRLNASAYPIVHVATHGQFGSTPEETYLVAWNELINVRDVSQMLQAHLGDREGIELLVLSACETASGDQQAALGLTGVAIKAGARSTVGSLWAINDEATSQFIGYFYEQLIKPEMTRAKAIRAAQLQMLRDPQYQHPIYWAPYILLGSWM